ncbi:restriction endonuclease subunit S [Vibrio antiquarius]|uniref:restriction endonuclease subunit S n=1 Tax=Vibrio antiquarius (strain Ex25) TaxID=150340 RepID=UPI0026595256|nr:restriction endonuclease subunit S [Vibrio antiquarius]MCR9932586.1 restriction endonuclease subunit S [Vibrio antiquarius]
MSQLPKGWVSTKLSVVGNTVTGNTPPRKNPEFYGGDVPFVKPGDIEVDKELTHTEETLSELGCGKARVLKQGSVLVTCIGNIGRVGLAMKPMATNQQINSIEFSELILPKYGFYYCRTLANWLNFNASATTVAIINKSKFSEAPFTLAPRAEQKRIVEKLDEVLAQVDTIKARLDGIPDLLKRFRQSVLASAVSGKLTEEWREQGELLAHILPSDYTTKKYGDVSDDEHYDNIPNSWGWVKLGSLAKLINGDRGKNYPNKSEYVDEGIAFINTGHIDPNGTLSFTRMNYISEDKFSSLGSGKIQKNDIVYCLRGATMGKTAIVDPFEVGAIASSLVIVRPSESLFYKFAYYFLVSPQARDQIQRFDNGSAQPNLSAKSLGMYPIGLPSLEEQKEIVRLVDQYFAFADTIEAQVKKAQARVDNLTQSILAKAFRGELVPQNDDDEPAEVLLERIAQARKEAEALAKAAKKAAKTKKTSK